MLVSGGKLLAIDKVNTDDLTISGDGVEQALFVNTEVIATNSIVDSVSSSLQYDIQTVSSNFDNYYLKSETSGSEQLSAAFDSIEKSIVQPYNIKSLTPNILYAGVEPDNTYVVSAIEAQDKLAFDGVYDPNTNKVATVETVRDSIKTVKPIVLEYNKPVNYTWEELQNIVPNVYVTNNDSAVFDLAVANEQVLIFRQHTAARINSDDHSQIHITELQLFKNLSWNTEAITYTVSDPWSDTGTGVTVSNGKVSINIDDSTVKINESNQLYTPDTVQRITYDVTKWAEIDFSKTLNLDVTILEDVQTNSSLYELTTDHITWLTAANDEVYFVKLTNADIWSISKLEINGTNYTAGNGLKLDGNEFSVDTAVIATHSDLEAQGNVILTYAEAPTQTYAELVDVVKTGKLFVLNGSEIVQADKATNDKIEFAFTDTEQKFNEYSLSSDLSWSHETVSIANDHKVSVAEGENPDYLQQVLVSDSDEITLAKVDSQLRIGLNLTGESDPKLTTMNESQINDSTNNYGSWWGGDEPPTWNETSRSNVMQYRMKRTSDAQGSLTLCRCALTNSWGIDRPIFRIGIFDLDMTLLGSSDYFVYDKTTGQFVGHLFNDTIAVAQGATVELDVPMHEETVGALKISRNTRYIIELITCGLSFAGKTQSGSGVTSNYSYDYTLENNLMISKSGELDWWTDLTGKLQADKIPYLSFGASTIRSSIV